MQQLSEMEKLLLQAIQKEEKVFAAKCQIYLQQCQDQNLTGVFQQLTNTSNHHQQMLTQTLAASGIQPNFQ